MHGVLKQPLSAYMNSDFNIDIIDSIYERIEIVGYENITREERHFFDIWWLEAEVNNGSFDQYFNNSSGLNAKNALEALTVIGAKKMSLILKKAIDLFPDNYFVPHVYDNTITDDCLSAKDMEFLDQLSDEFIEYPEDLSDLVESYYKKNVKNFLGPKNLVELWHSKKNRGANTKPKYITKNLNLEKEIISDRKISSRSCPECDYPSPDYKLICKKCGFPHGRVR